MSESHEDLVVESEASDSTQETLVEGAASNTEVTIDDVLKERDEFKDIALRVQADFENYRKRAASQMGDELDRALGKLVEQLLPVLDACEAAVAHGVEGVEQVWSSLIGALQKQGLEVCDQPFATSE